MRQSQLSNLCATHATSLGIWITRQMQQSGLDPHIMSCFMLSRDPMPANFSRENFMFKAQEI